MLRSKWPGVDASGIIGPPGPVGPSGGGGFGYYFHEDASDIPPYESMSRSPIDDPEVSDAVVVSTAQGAAGTLFGTGYLSGIGDPGVSQLAAGIWQFNLWVAANSVIGGRVSTVYVKVYKRDSLGILTLLFTTANSSAISVANTPQFKTIPYTQTTPIALDPTDRLLFEVFGVQNGSVNTATITYYYEGTAHTSYVLSPTGGGTVLFLQHAITAGDIADGLMNLVTPLATSDQIQVSIRGGGVLALNIDYYMPDALTIAWDGKALEGVIIEGDILFIIYSV